MRSVRQTVERRFESYSGSRFFGDESRVCCGCGAGSPSRPSLFTSTWFFIISCIHKLCMVVSLSVVHCAPLQSLQSCFLGFWHYHPYILQHFNEMFFTLVDVGKTPTCIVVYLEPCIFLRAPVSEDLHCLTAELPGRRLRS